MCGDDRLKGGEKKKKMNKLIGVTKLDTTCKLNTTRHEISRLWVKV